jgi:hypothetical protein
MTATKSPRARKKAAPRFDYGVAHLREFGVATETDKLGRTQVTAVTLGGEPLKPSKRFWHSLQVRFGFTQNIFRYFTHAEVFRRISEVAPNDSLRYCVERDGKGRGSLLAVTNPTTAVATHAELTGLVNRYGAEDVTYHDGTVRSTHSPRHSSPFAIAGDQFAAKYVIDSPIDGFGRPSVYLSLLRQVCSNGAIAFAPAFRSELTVGKGNDAATFALVRALEGFNNEDGYAAMRDRFEAATRSWASVAEVQRLYKLLTRLYGTGNLNVVGGDGAAEVPVGSPLFRNFHKMTGDLSRLYGLANLDTLSPKRQRTLPTAARMYDVLNFTSELATHHATPEAAKALHAYLGQAISGEYDLEGTAEQFADWRDFFHGTPGAN